MLRPHVPDPAREIVDAAAQCLDSWQQDLLAGPELASKDAVGFFDAALCDPVVVLRPPVTVAGLAASRTVLEAS